jgi:DnaJ-class molecular chaperone
MSHTCGACNGTGDCQNDFHELVNVWNPFLGADDVCPACGGKPAEAGNCSVCGGSGEQDD